MRANLINVIDRQPVLGARALAIVVTVFVCVFGLASVFILRSPETYRATARVEFQQEKPGDTDALSMEPRCWTSPESRFCRHLLVTEGLIAVSDQILQGAFDRLRTGGEELPEAKRRTDFPGSIREFRSALELSARSNLISITAAARDPKRAAQMANAVAEEYCLATGRSVGAFGLRRVVKDKALPATGPLRHIKPMQSAWAGFGSALLALAAGYAFLWRAGRRRSPPVSFDPFLSCFVILFCFVTGVTTLVPSANVAVGVALGAWIGFVVGAAAYWRTRLASTFSIAAEVYVAVFVGAYVLRLLYGLATVSLGPPWFEGKASVRLTAHADQGEGPGAPRRASTVCDPRFLYTECDIIGSAELLGRFVAEQNLVSLWTSKYEADVPLKTEEAIHLLQGRLTIEPVGGSSLLEVRVVDGTPTEATRLAQALAEIYCQYRERIAPAFYYGKRVRGALVAQANAKHLPNRSSRLVNPLLTGVLLACTAVGGAVLAVWLAGPRARRVRSWLPMALLLLLLGVVALVIFRALSPDVYSSSARVSLQCCNDPLAPDLSPARYSPLYDASLLEKECAFIKALQPSRRSRLEVYPVPLTSLLNITARSNTPEGAARTVNTLAGKYVSLRAKGLPDAANPDGLCAELIQKASPTPHTRAHAARNPILASLVSVIDYLFFAVAGAFVGWITVKVRASPRLNKVVFGPSTQAR